MYATLESLLAHYIRMAALDKDFAWRRVKELARDCPALYADLPRLLTEAMLSASASPAEPSAA